MVYFNPNKSKLHSWRPAEQIELMQYMLLFGPESFAIQFAVKIYKDLTVQIYSFACCIMQVWNLVSHIEGGA